MLSAGLSQLAELLHFHQQQFLDMEGKNFFRSSADRAVLRCNLLVHSYDIPAVLGGVRPVGSNDQLRNCFFRNTRSTDAHGAVFSFSSTRTVRQFPGAELLVRDSFADVVQQRIPVRGITCASVPVSADMVLQRASGSRILSFRAAVVHWMHRARKQPIGRILAEHIIGLQHSSRSHRDIVSQCIRLIEMRCANPAAVDAFETMPSPGVCRICEHYDGPARGAGDVVHSVAKATGIAAVVHYVTDGNCLCPQRRAALNAALPFTDSTEEGT